MLYKLVKLFWFLKMQDIYMKCMSCFVAWEVLLWSLWKVYHDNVATWAWVDACKERQDGGNR